MRNAVRFTSTLFNCTEAKDHFINDCCFGDDLGSWLKARLEAAGHSVEGPEQEDWGWYLDVSRDGRSHYLNIGFSGDDEWLMWIEPRRSLVDRLRGRNREAEPQLVRDLHAIFKREPEIIVLRWIHMHGTAEESPGSPEPE
jgi:hypothetical protein